MKKLLIRLGLLMALPLTALQTSAAVPEYDMAAAKANAQADFANWMKYLPDDVFVAHVSIPGTHDTATGWGFCHSYAPLNAGGATYSQTQMASIDAQLEGGIRAFDFRPGVHEGKLYCAHGVDITKYTMEDAFTKLTNYLDAHPGEFFVIHFFRGNVGYSGSGMSTSESDRDNYNKLIDEFFNKGKFAEYIVDYDPRLKVKDIRGKMVLLRRDRLDFAHFAKAGNFGEWPWEDDVWTDGGDRFRTLVTHASDPTIRGYIRVSDMSSPDDDNQIEQKKTAVKNLYDWCRKQPTPNSTQNGNYKPDWTMTFTSGEHQKFATKTAFGTIPSGRKGYALCAHTLNPYYTSLINDTPDGEKGPCGIILSDWVLTDYSQDNEYQVYGHELVPAIAMNNFDYIQKYILDDTYFNDDVVLLENYWEDEKEYFLRNVGTGEFLSVGANHGTRGNIVKDSKYGLPVKFKFEDSDGTYQLKTSLGGSNNGIGYNGWGYFMDYGSLESFAADRVSPGKFVFKVTSWKDNGKTQALKVVPLSYDWRTNWGVEGKVLQYKDGSTYVARAEEYDPADPLQQWEVIGVDEYLDQQANLASRKNPVDLSFTVRGGKFVPNDTYNWTGSPSSKSKINAEGIETEENRDFVLHFNSQGYSIGAGSSTKDGTKWSLTHSIPILKTGKYTLKFKLAYNNISFAESDGTLTFKINGTSVKSKVSDKNAKNISEGDAANAVKQFQDDPDNYTISVDFDELAANSEIKLELSKGRNSSKTSLYLDDFELLYYGPDPEKRYVVLRRAINDAKRRLTDMGKTIDGISENSINFQEYEDGILSNAYSGQGEDPALEIYEKLRALTYEKLKDSTSPHQNYTNAIINAGFETGTMMGWETSYTGSSESDTGVKPTNDDRYQMEGSQNNFLFNTWQKLPEVDGRGTILSQTITGLPAGEYTLTARAANNEGDCMYIDVNGQLSEPLFVGDKDSNTAYDKTISGMISFKFQVAANTDEVTISFLGSNSDGSYDDFGGNWYKLDDVHLYREGDGKTCVFFERLTEAVNRAKTIADNTLPQYYIDLWETEEYNLQIQQMIDNHLKSGHTDDTLEGSNGLEERTALFDHLSQVVLSQAESKANMSGAIRNNSFELGDLSYWNTKAAPAADAVVTTDADARGVTGRDAKKDEKYFYYAKHEEAENDIHAYPIYQKITGLPAGTYILSAKVTSDAGNKFALAANSDYSIATIDNGNQMQTVTVKFEIAEDNSPLLLGLYPVESDDFAGQEVSAEFKGPWYAVDNFELQLVGRQVSIDWVMETPTHGTIILPFAVGADELKEKGLEIYGLTQHEESIAEGATHKILKYTKHNDLEAHTPYVVMRAGSELPEAKAVKSVKAAETDDDLADRTFTFKGFTTNEKMAYKSEYQDGALTGVLVPTEADKAQYHLQSYEDNVGFVLHEEGPDDHHAVEPYHAYITLPEESQGDVNIHGLYFEEPILPLEWMMEGNHYGTIILPFAVAKEDMPEGLIARKISGVSTSRNAITHTYQIAQLGGEEESLEANTPYLVYSENPVKDAITFRGIATNKENEYLEGVLKGSLQKHDKEDESALQAGHWVLYEDEDGTAYFEMINENTSLNANHAYIFNPNAGETPVEQASVKGVKLMADEPSATPSADVILLSEDQAEQTYPWQMEGPDYGTIILPFKAQVPEGLEAYELTGLKSTDATEWPKSTDTYSVLTKTQATELVANKAYLLVKKGSAGSSEEDKDYTLDNDKATYTFTGTPDAETDPAITGILQGNYTDNKEVNTVGSYLVGEYQYKQFERIESENNGGTVAPLHAYIPASAVPTATAGYLILMAPNEDGTVGVDEIMKGGVNVDIYTLDGVMVRRDVNAAEALKELERGIYILRSAKGTVKVIK